MQEFRNCLNPTDATIEKQPDEKLDGADCFVVSSSAKPTNMVSSSAESSVKLGQKTITYWVGKQDYLIHQIKTIIAKTSVSLPESDSEISTMLEGQHKPATPEAIAAMRAMLTQANRQVQAMTAGQFISIQKHENISSNEKFSAVDFKE